jgi:hypothetical protein
MTGCPFTIRTRARIVCEPVEAMISYTGQATVTQARLSPAKTMSFQMVTPALLQNIPPSVLEVAIKVRVKAPPLDIEGRGAL